MREAKSDHLYKEGILPALIYDANRAIEWHHSLAIYYQGLHDILDSSWGRTPDMLLPSNSVSCRDTCHPRPYRKFDGRWSDAYQLAQRLDQVVLAKTRRGILAY